jgi:biopolymer transport protein ExbD
MRYFEQRKARIEIVPMIDIMLFLLVFFAMMTLRMIPTSGHVTKLPTSSTAAPLVTPKLLVELAADGSMVADGRPVQAPELTAWLRGHDGAHTAVTLAGTDTVELQKVMAAIDAVRLGGATQISIATRNGARSAP